MEPGVAKDGTSRIMIRISAMGERSRIAALPIGCIVHRT